MTSITSIKINRTLSLKSVGGSVLSKLETKKKQTLLETNYLKYAPCGCAFGDASHEGKKVLVLVKCENWEDCPNYSFAITTVGALGVTPEFVDAVHASDLPDQGRLN